MRGGPALLIYRKGWLPPVMWRAWDAEQVKLYPAAIRALALLLSAQ